MTTLLTREQVDTLRSIGDGALVLMALWMIDLNYPGRASKSNEIAMYIRKDVRTVEKQLNELCASNRVVNTSAGYILLEGGRALVLEMAPKALALSPDNSQALVTEVQALEAPLSAAPLSASTPTSPQMEDRHFGGVDSHAHNARALKGGGGERDSFSLKDSKILSTPPQEDAQNVRTVHGVTVLDILGATEKLFGDGHPVFRKGLCLELLEKDTKSVLAVMAHCWQNRATADHPRGLQNPAGKAYIMLRDFLEDGNKPRREYQLDPWAYLPEEFKEVFGMACYECQTCHKTFERKAEYETHLATRDGHADEIACEQCGQKVRVDFMAAHVRMHEEQEADAKGEAMQAEAMQEIDDSDVVHAWRTVLGLLAAEMPKASFETWVRDTVAVRYDGHATLTVATRNSYARDWLTDRMTTTIERLLAGVGGSKQFSRVEFVAAS